MIAKADQLIESTIDTLDSGSDSVEPKDGASLISDWIKALRKEELLHSLADQLQTLYDELNTREPDGKMISALLEKLSVQTAKAARRVNRDYQDSLEDLADSLKEFSKELR
ncbi:hypothetical protein ACFSUS_10540 [Spirosoma soli]|uniref:Uncharacterized protein n=1 Tax=Spirosoma soli TaxID=1770529 RepID=A0ABW5M202_9BACT